MPQRKRKRQRLGESVLAKVRGSLRVGVRPERLRGGDGYARARVAPARGLGCKDAYVDGSTDNLIVERLQVEGGFLDGLDLRLAEGLNVLVGARGTGKTSVIELIRFCTDAPALAERFGKRS